MHWLWFLIGTTDPGGWPYLLWSGIAGYLIMAGAFLRHRNCHTRWCWRLGRHEFDIDGAKHVLCRRHHPHLDNRPPTARQISDQAKGTDDS